MATGPLGLPRPLAVGPLVKPDTNELVRLAKRVDERFGDNVIPLVDNAGSGPDTLVVEVEGDDHAALADEVEEFLDSLGARTRREPYDDFTRVLGVV